MKNVLIAFTLPTIIGLAVFLFPRPAQAETAVPYHEQVIHSCFDQVINSETLTQELLAVNNKLASMVFFDSRDCLVCQVAALLALRQNDGNWADTIGEFVDDNELDSCIVEVLYDSECQHK